MRYQDNTVFFNIVLSGWWGSTMLITCSLGYGQCSKCLKAGTHHSFGTSIFQRITLLFLRTSISHVTDGNLSIKSVNNCLIKFVSKCSNHDTEFFRLDLPMRICSHKRTCTTQKTDCFCNNGASKGRNSGAINLPIGDWLFYEEGGTYSAILCIVLSPFIVIWVHAFVYLKGFGISQFFGTNQYY